MLCGLSLTGCGEYWTEGYSDAYVVEDYIYTDDVSISSSKASKTVFTLEWAEDHVGDLEVAVVTSNGSRITPKTPIGDGCQLMSSRVNALGNNEVQVECDHTCKGNFKIEVENQCTSVSEVKYVIEQYDRYGSINNLLCDSIFVSGSEQKIVPILL